MRRPAGAAALAITRGSRFSVDAPFSVFSADEAAVVMTRVESTDAGADDALVLEQHPGGRVHAVDGALVSEESRVRMLAAWMRG